MALVLYENIPADLSSLIVTTILFMITATLYGEGLRREKIEKAAKQPISQSNTAPVPVPVPVPVPEKPVTK